MLRYNSFTNPQSNADRNAYSKSNSDTDTMYGAMWAHTTATPFTALTPDSAMTLA